MLKQVKQNRAFEDVISQIQDLILQGELRSGERLPSERQLLEIFKVSRGTLREAFRVLEEKGLITVKKGVKGGAIACQVDTKLMSENLDLLLRYQKVTLKELGEFRETVEPLVGAKAAQKATKDDMDKLSIFLQHIRGYLTSSEPKWNELIEEDSNFHLALAKIAGNRVFESILITIYGNITRYFDEFLPRDVKILKGIYRDFFEILNAMEKKNSDQVHKIIYNHVKRFNEMMENHAGKRTIS